MELLFILIISAYLTRQAAQAVPDAIALAKGKTPPSIEKWKLKHPDKPIKPGMRGYFGRMLTNSVEAWADRSNRKHRRRKMLQAARQRYDDSEWLRKKIARTDKRAERAERWAAKFGVMWDKTKSAATARRDENAAWDEDAAWDANAARSASTAADAGASSTSPPPGPGSAPPPGAMPPPGSMPHGGGRAAPQGARTSPGGTPPPADDYEEPIVHDSDRYRFSNGTYPFNDTHREGHGLGFGGPIFDRSQGQAPEAEQPGTIRAEGEIVRDTPPEPPAPLQLEAGPSSGSTEVLDAEVVEDSSAPAGSPAGSPTATTMEDANMTASAEITNLPAAKAYTAKMTEYLDRINGVVEAQKAEMATLAADLTAELGDAELAMSSLQNNGFSGDPVAQFQLANEQLTQMQQALANAEQALNPLPDNAASAKGAYDKAAEAFDRQVGIAEQVQAQAATGNVADNTRFYENA
ncbi:hypothetical protein ACFORH_43095 [Amycolatopsis roodepoortensis]|uniref:Uncharacterized protein n=1 Tax=Amycolatopsis roodepoortensis TaxID=700274 RepID=A0ABR9LIV5_9PSEU|nr:hypothetical protein [Amycolatopsis roodepoortensis]MBE1580472.1 hypothetical protein [Amycolatopsis roodepoortensis]